VYATVFSGFYLALILLLFALIFRSVAIEFRSQQPGAVWRQTWDVAFSVASIVAAPLMGIALGNVVRGILLDAAGNYTGTFFDLLNPYALTVGVTTVTLFVMHGAIYLTLRTEGTGRSWSLGGFAPPSWRSPSCTWRPRSPPSASCPTWRRRSSPIRN
jgi:cytochrome d ubiquinol oxidase subunit II